MRNFQEAIEKLGSRESRKLENNTYLQRRDENTVAVRLHATDVVTYRKNGAVILSSGGWQTPTTKARINSYSPVTISQQNGVWYVRNGSDAPEVTFADGLTYRAGKFSHCGPEPEKQQKERAKVRKFAKEFITKLEAGEIPMPSGGDCWFCSMREVGTGKPMGELSGRTPADHVVNHLKERYFVPSLLVNALKASGAGSAWFGSLNAYWKENWNLEGAEQARRFPGSFGKYVGRMLTRYLYRQMGMVR
jgi:hypothetical protein